MITDVCFCEYTSHGHWGIIYDNDVDNDATLPNIAKQVISHARAGADMVAPSGMMDGMIETIREALDNTGFPNLPIIVGGRHATIKPDWVQKDKVKGFYNAIPVINAGENPMGEILSRINRIEQDEIFLFRTPFYPAPILDKISKKGCMTYSEETGENDFENFVIKGSQ